MKNTIKRTLFGLFCVVMAYVFVSCSNGEPPFIPVVNYTEEVSSSVNEIPAGTYKIYHLWQKTTGGTNPNDYEQLFSEDNKIFSKASKLSDVAILEPGFSCEPY